MYKKVSTNLNFSKREEEIQKFWKENNIFEKSITLREGKPVFTFYDGPPTANGKPHIGHILTRAIKDLIPRYKTMKGYKVLRKAGWDTHGLPVELEVEKALKISGKPQIEAYGVESFVKQCKESVWKYEEEWREVSERVGYWADMDNPYITYENDYIESVWWALKQIWDKNLIYKGHKVVPYCPRCGTSLSSHEVAQGYKDITEKSIYVKFKVKNKVNEYFLAWTTTPWTLPSNVALVVNPNENYCKVSSNGKVYIIAEALVSSVLPETSKVLETLKGSELEYIEYEPLFDFTSVNEKAYYITCDNYVTLTDGTGIVHNAPAFGEDDARVANKYNLPFIQLVNEQGKFVDSVKPWANVFVKDADPYIIQYLNENGNLFKSMEYEHSYPFCWRCDTHLIYYARDTWFIRMTEMREHLVKNNNTVNWLPENIKQGRFGNFLDNVIDWGFSRERYWGTPLPIWECSCGHKHLVGSVEDLKRLSNQNLENLELHKPYIDNVLLNCPKCSNKMYRVAEVIDCWFDSGCMPFAQHHYPFKNKEIFEQNFPANFISEAVDQTRGWFYTLMAISTVIFDKAPYKNVIVLGHVQDKNGQKMSKHKGNVVDPWHVLNTHGADAVRWYFYSNSAPWLPSRFHEDAVSEYQRRFMGTFWNTYAFYVLYANIDNFNPNNYEIDYNNLPIMDRWILSKLNSLVKFVDESLQNYKLTEPARALDEFVDNLSNWYVRRSRERFWVSDMPNDKINAYKTLYTVLTTLTKLSAPFIPFMSEEIYQNLVCSIDSKAPNSVHLCDYPTAEESYIDTTLELNMDTVLRVVVLGRATRNVANIKNRQPIGTMYIKMDTKLDTKYIDIITEELNIKNIKFLENTAEFTSFKFKPQLRTLGPKYGNIVPKISKFLAEVDSDFIQDLRQDGGAKITIDGREIVLFEDDILIETIQKEGYIAESDKDITVVLDTTLSTELINEGFVREIVSKIQTMRKEAGFEVLDKIDFYHNGNNKLAEIINNNLNEIKTDVLATNVYEGTNPDGYFKKWNINNEELGLTVIKNNN